MNRARLMEDSVDVTGECRIRIAILRFATNDYKLNLNWINFRRIEIVKERWENEPDIARKGREKNQTISNWFVKPQPLSHTHGP